jgi:hypothetical protein
VRQRRRSGGDNSKSADLISGDNCHMVYGDAQAVLVQMIEAVRGLGLPAAA